MRNGILMGALIVLLVALAAVQPGCSLTQTQSEHAHVYDRVFYHDVYMIPDDVDLLLMLDRPTRLSRWLVTY